jgi:hemerythrin-like domain-containing protein
MCEHCGCRGAEPIAELMDEHFVLLELSGDIRRALTAQDHDGAAALLSRLEGLLGTHVRREERGVFTALRADGEFVGTVEELEAEHLDLDHALEGLDPRADDFGRRVEGLLDELSEHIDKENLGLFPVSVVTLGASGWATVAAAHAETATFLSRGAGDRIAAQLS